MPSKREGRVPSYMPFLLILLVGLAGLTLPVHVASSSAQHADSSSPPSQAGSTTLQGDVLKITSVLEDGLIVTYADLSVSRVLTGPASLVGNKIVVKYTGGEVNGVLLWVSGEPYLCVGETVEIEVRQEGDFYVLVSPKKTLSTPTGLFATSAGYVLMWYKPGTGWQVSTARPGADWYGPAKWSSGAFDYRINTANIPGDVSSSSFITYATASFQTWEDDPGSSIDFSYLGTGTGTAGSQDGANTVGWGSIGGSTIAVTYDWASYSTGNYDSLRITETDMKFDSSKSWSAQSSGVTGRYDVQNIGTHEAGHTFGLGDMYESADSEQTMYGYGSTGETKKRTLEWGDRAGVAALYPQSAATVTATVTVTSTVPSTLYSYRTTTTTSTSYTSTSTSTSTVPTATTVVLVPLTITSTAQSTRYLTSTATTTVTNYTDTQILTSMIPTVTTVALVASTVTSIVQSIQYLTSILSTTVTSYTGTQTSTSTVVVPTTVVLVPFTTTSTALSTEYLSSTETTTVTSYTSTTTSTSTSVVYTTVTVSQGGAGADASSPLAYLGFMSLLAITVGHTVTADRSWRIPRSSSGEHHQGYLRDKRTNRPSRILRD
ncbi:MAG: matrixin family metalloprotease [Candidatus Bathyarchaeia archaeon]